MGPISTVQRYFIGGLGFALLLALAWGFRVDHLRGTYLERLNVIRIDLSKAGVKTPAKNPGNGVALVIAQRNEARTDRDAARQLVDIQSNSIARLGQETETAKARAEANRKAADEAARQRDFWIKQARTASTRTERLSAEQELAECEAVLDSLYSSGF